MKKLVPLVLVIAAVYGYQYFDSTGVSGVLSQQSPTYWLQNDDYVQLSVSRYF